MGFYPAPIKKRFESPSNSGADRMGMVGGSASFVCGSFVELSVRMKVDADSIDAVTFRTNGCGFMIAAADTLCEWLSGKALLDLHGLNDDELTQAICVELGAFPADRAQCAGVVFESLRNAMALHRERRIEEYEGEKALICTCFGISEESIIAAISANGYTEVEQVSETCRAGSGCGSCRMLIQELVDMQTGGFGDKDQRA